MHLDWDALRYLLFLPGAWILKLIWSDHKSIQDLREEMAREYPTRHDVKYEIERCTKEQKEDLKYIRDRVDTLVDRELNRK